MPHEIKVGDEYSDEKGKSVRIVCTDRKAYKYTVVGLVKYKEGEIVEVYTNQGLSGSLAQGDLILPPGHYDEWEIDDPIWVWYDRDCQVFPQHFAGLDKDGKVLAWDCGTTSHSAGNLEPAPWPNASKTDPRNSK
jgi:hypothetical protein